MTNEKPSIVGDPRDPRAYVEEFLHGETSYNPEKLSRAYMTLAEESGGSERLAYCALAWAAGSTRREVGLSKRIKELEKRIAILEGRS